MQATIRALLDLQGLDEDIFRLRMELKRLPAEQTGRRTKIDAVIAKRDAVAKVSHDLRVRIKEIEDLTTIQRQRVRKLDNQAHTTKTDMALLAAYQHEIRSLKREIGQAEEEGLSLVEQADAADAERARLETQISEGEEVHAEFSANVERETAEARTKLEELEKLREERRSGDIDPEAFTLYERLLTAREGVALAELDGRICQMCFMEVTPNLYVRVVRGTQVAQCPSCDRILYQRS